MRALIVSLALLAGCDGVLVVDVGGIPRGTQRIGVIATYNGNNAPAVFFDPPADTGVFATEETLGIRFPADDPQAAVYVAATAFISGRACVLADAYTTLSISAGRNDVPVSLTAYNPPQCN
jgi:hypothetical protein